jgi:hypothetical protein
MPAFDRSVATLRIFGTDLVPNEVSRLLGSEPTQSRTRGEVLVSKSGRARVWEDGRWSLSTENSTPEDLEEQIWWLLNSLTQDLAVWRELAARYEIDLFCGLFMSTSNDGLSLSAAALKALGDRGIELSLDIYDAVED